MPEDKYVPALATATICATGTLGPIIPPSISLVLLGDVLGKAYQEAQLGQGILSPKTVSVGDLFAGALIPGLVLVVIYFFYMLMTAFLTLAKVGGRIAMNHRDESPGQSLAKTLLAPIMLILLCSVRSSEVSQHLPRQPASGPWAHEYWLHCRASCPFRWCAP